MMVPMNLSILMMTVALAASEAVPSSVQDLAWISGCWASVDGEAGSGETWTLPAGGSFWESAGR